MPWCGTDSTVPCSAATNSYQVFADIAAVTASLESLAAEDKGGMGCIVQGSAAAIKPQTTTKMQAFANVLALALCTQACLKKKVVKVVRLAAHDNARTTLQRAILAGAAAHSSCPSSGRAKQHQHREVLPLCGADSYEREGNEEQQYVMLMRFASLILETLPGHQDYKKADPKYVRLKKTLADKVFPQLEQLKIVLQTKDIHDPS
ncbi:MPN domain-containing protein, partial [Haematococcus lacustris]